MISPNTRILGLVTKTIILIVLANLFIFSISSAQTGQATIQIEHSDWQVYRDPKWAFKISYPSNWKVQNSPFVGFGFWIYSNDIEVDPLGRPSKGAYLSVDVLDKTEYSLPEHKQNTLRRLWGVSEKSIEISGNVTEQLSGYTFDGLATLSSAIEHNDHIYIFEFVSLINKEKDYVRISSDMLASIELLDEPILHPVLDESLKYFNPEDFSFPAIKHAFEFGKGMIISGYEHQSGSNIFALDICEGDQCTKSEVGDYVIAPTDITLDWSGPGIGMPPTSKDLHIFEIADSGEYKLCMQIGHLKIRVDGFSEGVTAPLGAAIGELINYTPSFSFPHIHMGLWNVPNSYSCATSEFTQRIAVPFEDDEGYALDGVNYEVGEEHEGKEVNSTNAPFCWYPLVTNTNDFGDYFETSVSSDLAISSCFPSEANVDVALIIDSSGSMTSSDPSNMRKEAAKAFVSVMQDADQVAIVDFDSYTRVPWHLGLVGGNRMAIETAVDTIDSSGGTNIGAGLQAGYNELVSSTTDYRKAAVLMTDGIGSYSGQASLYRDQGWPVYTIGLGPYTDEALLETIASETGGRYFKLDTASQLANVYFEIATEVAQGEIVGTYTDTMTQGSLWEVAQTILDNLKSVFFFVSWPGSDVSVTLITPDGTIIDPSTTDPSVFHAKGLTYELYRVDNPIPGDWTIQMYGADLPADGEVVTLQVSIVGGSVSNQPPSLALPGEQYVQYSDSLTFNVFASDPDNPADSLIFTAAGLPDSLSLTDNGDGTATISGIVTDPPGAHIVEITVSDPEGLSDTAVAPIIIAQEDARSTYTGPMLISTPCTDCSTAIVPLRATIQDITDVLDDPAYDAYPGDITLADVDFIDRDTKVVLCSASVILFDPSNTTIGTATCEWAADISSNDGLDFNLGILVGGYYVRNSTADDAIVVVSKPSENSITGGGYLLNQSTAGLYAGDANLRTHFGFNVKFIENKKGRGQDIVGRASAIIRQGENVYRIKTNALDSLIVQPASDNGPAVAEFLSKASIEDVTDPNNPILMNTQAVLNFTITDFEEASGQYRDLLGITLWGKNGKLLFSSNWTGTQTIEQAIEAGNLEIHQFTEAVP